jgi:hypothetical protein
MSRISNPEIMLALVILGIIVTAILFVVMQVDKKTFYVYTFFKYFFMVIFILRAHQYMACYLKRVLQLKHDDGSVCKVEESDDDPGNETYHENLINHFFS